MKSSAPKRLGIALLRTILIFAAIWLISFLANAIFWRWLLDKSMLSSLAVAGWYTAFLFFIVQSTVFAFHRHNEKARQKFMDTYANSGLLGLCRSVFSSIELYVEMIGLVGLSVLFSQVYSCVGNAFFGESFAKWQASIIFLPVLLALVLLAHFSVRSAWSADSRSSGKKGKSAKERSPLVQTLRSVLFVAAFYCAFAMVTPWYLPVVITLLNFGKDGVVLALLVTLIPAGLLALVAFHYIRAIQKRRHFIAKLQAYCRAHSISLSKIQNPYRSVFVQQKGVDFTLENNGKVYACKLIGSVFPGSPLIFADTGEGIRSDILRLFRVNLLQLNTRLDYRMEDAPAGCHKRIIVLPVPTSIYASVGGGSPRPADTGEILGEYILYNATGFLGALERDHL
jgi:hypothetical protein